MFYLSRVAIKLDLDDNTMNWASIVLTAPIPIVSIIPLGLMCSITAV